MEVAIALAALEARCGNVSAARKTYRSAEVAARQAPELLGRLLIEWASLERQMLEPGRAQRLLDRTTLKLPHSAKALLLGALLKWEAGERRQARSLLKTALLLPIPKRGSDEWRRQIELFTTWAKLEAALRSQAALTRALAVIGRADARFGGDESLLQARGALRVRFGEPEAAREDFRAAMAHGGSAPVFVAWALLEESEGNIPEACLPRRPPPSSLPSPPAHTPLRTLSTHPHSLPPRSSLPRTPVPILRLLYPPIPAPISPSSLSSTHSPSPTLPPHFPPPLPLPLPLPLLLPPGSLRPLVVQIEKKESGEIPGTRGCDIWREWECETCLAADHAQACLELLDALNCSKHEKEPGWYIGGMGKCDIWAGNRWAGNRWAGSVWAGNRESERLACLTSAIRPGA